MKKLSEDKLKENIINMSKSNTPDLWDRISNEIDKNSSDITNIVNISSKNSTHINSNKRKPLGSKYIKGFSGVAAIIVLVLGIGFITKTHERNSDTALSTNDMKDSIADTGTANNSNTDMDDSTKSFDNSPVNYSNLNFAPLDDLYGTSKDDSTNLYGGESLSIVAFSEDILADISIMSKVTLLNMYFKDYKYDTYSDKFEPNGRLHQWDRTVVYEVRIDDLYYNNGDVKVGDVIKIEDRCFNGCYLTDEPLLKLKVNRQYILPLYSAGETILYSFDDYAEGDITRDGQYGIAYQFAPQIEVTLDNEYLFHDGWQSLINDKTVDVVMDSETAEENFYNDKMKLRSDDKFIDDLKSLIERYK